MNTGLKKTAKYMNLARAYISSQFNSTPAFIRIIPTDRCNLDCAYCWQKDNNSPDMTFESFRKYLEKATRLRAGIITFLGGEPMLWEPLFDAVSECTEKSILTDLTTNGSLLTENTIARLGRAGLDYLNISNDSAETSPVSRKNYLIRNDLTDCLKEARSEFRMHFRINAVIYRNNFEEIKDLIEYSSSYNIQLSLGFIVPPLGEMPTEINDIYFSLEDETLLREIISYIVEKKKSGCPIIDPVSYFENIFRYLKRESFWQCNYPTRFGWINVTPNGRIRTCTKKMDELQFDFLELNTDNLKTLREILSEKVSECNIDCYSNCAYDSYFYTHNKLQMLKKVLTRISRTEKNGSTF